MVMAAASVTDLHSFTFIHSHSFYCIRKSMQYNNTNRRNIGFSLLRSLQSTSLSLSLSLSLSVLTAILHSRCLLKQRMMEVVVTAGAIGRAKLQTNHYHQQTNTKSFFTGRMPFLSPNHQCQSTAVYISVNVKGKVDHSSLKERRRVLNAHLPLQSLESVGGGPLMSVTRGQCDVRRSDLRLPFQPQGITGHWLVPNYTVW